MSVGLRWMALSAFWFSIMSLLVKWAGQRLPYQQLVFARGFVTLVMSVVGVSLLWHRERVSPWGNRRFLLAFRGVLGFLGLNLYYYSLVSLPLADASLIMNTSPVLTAVIASWWLRERNSGTQWVVVFIAFVGVVWVAQPPLIFGGDAPAARMRDVGVAFLGALVASVAYTAVRELSRTERREVILLYFPLVATVLTVPMLPGHWLWPTWTEWALLLGIGVSTQLAQVAMTRGLALETAGRAMTMSYLQVALAVLWGALIFRELPSVATIAGALCIVVALAVLARASANHDVS